MKRSDVDRERSEESLSLPRFLKSYNEGLPVEFPRASLSLLREFRKAHKTIFKGSDSWSLDQHRKKVMDWLPSLSI